MPKVIDPEPVEGKEPKKVVIVEEVPEENQEIKKDLPAQAGEIKISEPVEELISEEKPNYLWIIIPTALLVGALVGGLITYFSGISKLSKIETSPTSTPSTEPQASPSPLPLSSIKRSEVKVQVLNGSGTSGLAGKVKTYLEGLGYKEVAVGNASNSNFDETEIQIKEAKKDFLKTIIDDLSKDYLVSKETKTLISSNKYDIIITVGSK